MLAKVGVVAAALVVVGASASAESVPTVEEVTKSIHGREVRVSGIVQSHGNPRSLILYTGGTGYPVDLALDRQAVARISACDPCGADVSAEIVVDGAFIRLLVFEVHDLSENPPGSRPAPPGHALPRSGR
jgi:hypothetical protein